MTETLIIPTLSEFLEEFGEEMEMCNEDAYVDFIELSKNSDISTEVFLNIISTHADDLDACHPEAFDMLYQLSLKLGIEI